MTSYDNRTTSYNVVVWKTLEKNPFEIYAFSIPLICHLSTLHPAHPHTH